MGLARTVGRIQRRLAQAIGVVVGLAGIGLVLLAVPPADAAAGLVILIGLVMLLVAYGMITRPGSVRFGTRPDEEAEEGPHRRYR